MYHWVTYHRIWASLSSIVRPTPAAFCFAWQLSLKVSVLLIIRFLFVICLLCVGVLRSVCDITLRIIQQKKKQCRKN